MSKRFLVIGAGYSGQAFARRIAGGPDWLGGTTRLHEKLADVARAGMRPFAFDGHEITAEFADALAGVTHLVMSAGPDGDGDPFLRVADGGLRALMPDLEWIGYLSTVGVYGNHDGAWVDEDTDCRPVSKRSVQRLEAEKAWMDAAREARVPLAILRLSGIYGPGRNAFVNLSAGKARRLVKPGQVFNRIHVDDIAGALDFISSQKLGGVFNVTDDEPAPPQDVVAFAAEVMGVDPPPGIAFEEAELSPMARSFYGENKRVSNARIKQAGYRFVYPDYRTALRAMWQSDDWS